MNTTGLPLLSLLVLSACELGNGRLVEETRAVSDFDRVVVSGGGELRLAQTGTEGLRIETDDNMMDNVTVKVDDRTLYLDLSSGFIPARMPTKLVFSVSYVDLSSLKTSGSWTVTADALVTDELAIRTSGSANLALSGLRVDSLGVHSSGSIDADLAGEAGRFDLEASGSGDYGAGNLKVEHATVDSSGSVKATLWVTQTLDAKLSGSSKISYFGHPEVVFSGSGSSSVTSLGDK